MEEQIKKTSQSIRGFFFAFWLLPVVLVVAGELIDSLLGVVADDVRTTYLMEAVTILLTALCVPLSLKLFSRVLARKIDKVSLPQALILYRRWSGVRLLLLALPVCVGLSTYYLALSTGGLLCALISLTASLFCVPGENRLRRELLIEENESDE